MCSTKRTVSECSYRSLSLVEGERDTEGVLERILRVMENELTTIVKNASASRVNAAARQNHDRRRGHEMSQKCGRISSGHRE